MPAAGSPEFLELERKADEAGFLEIDDATEHDNGDETGKGAVTDWSGRVVGPYSLVRLIGKGGGGVVYEATQQDPIKRKVAIKFFTDRHFGDRS